MKLVAMVIAFWVLLSIPAALLLARALSIGKRADRRSRTRVAARPSEKKVA
jgi:hypothetical protein